MTTDDGLGGLEGAFAMCTFWLVEALTRAGKYDKKLLLRAQVMFEQMVSYANHLGLFSEEIARSGELLGNFPQAFTHISFISGMYLEALHYKSYTAFENTNLYSISCLQSR